MVVFDSEFEEFVVEFEAGSERDDGTAEGTAAVVVGDVMSAMLFSLEREERRRRRREEKREEREESCACLFWLFLFFLEKRGTVQRCRRYGSSIATGSFLVQ